jgi:hypothetical protein
LGGNDEKITIHANLKDCFEIALYIQDATYNKNKTVWFYYNKN